MTKPTRHVSAGVILLATLSSFAAGCRGFQPPDGPTGASPSPGQPGVVTSLTIAGPRVVPVGMSVFYSASATYATGVVLGDLRGVLWGVDNLDVADIYGSGELRARRQGSLTVTAQLQGIRATFDIQIGDSSATQNTANLVIVFTPDPVPGSPRRCANSPGSPTWTINEKVAETHGIGFTQETFSFNLYDASGTVVYADTEVEKYYFAAHSEFTEEFCTSLSGAPSGFYADLYEGVDDRGNRLAFTSGRLQLRPVGIVPDLISLLTPGQSGGSMLRKKWPAVSSHLSR